MAHLPPEDDESSNEEYSESFELDGTDSGGVSSGMSHCSSDMETSERDTNHPTHTTSPSPTVKKPPRPKREHDPGGMDLGRTVRSPIAMSRHLQGTWDVAAKDKENQQPITFSEVAGKVQKLQLSAKKFKSSDEIRDVAFKEWLAKKEVKDLRARKLLEQSERIDHEKKKNKEVSHAFCVRETRVVRGEV